MEDFIINAILATIGISIIAGSLGCFIIWRRLAYFSDSISHSALLGISLGIVSGLNIHFGLILVSTLFAFFIVILQKKSVLPSDAILGILSHIALSIGIVVLGFVSNANTDYFGLLFGDILTVSNSDIIWIYLVLVIIISLLYVFWEQFLLLSLNPDLAVAEGLNYNLYQLLFMLMIAITVAVLVQIAGVLLTSSLLIMPPVIAKTFAKTPFQMIFIAVLFAMLAVMLGIFFSTLFDIATGPAIVIVLGSLFTLSQLLIRK